MERDEIRVCAPATVSSLGVGYNVLGLALDGLGNTVTARRSSGGGVRIVSSTGGDGSLSADVGENPAGVAAVSTLDKAGIELDVELEVRIDIPRGSGLGSATACAVAAAFAVNKLLGSPLRKHELIGPCLEAQAAGPGIWADQVAPALLGGLILVRCVEPLDVVRLPLVSDLTLAIVTPHALFDLDAALAALPRDITPDDIIHSSANIAAFTSACFTSDVALLARCIGQDVVTDYRSRRIPGCEEVIRAALSRGALGSALCGAGPSIFALCRSERSARDAAQAMQDLFADRNVASSVLLSAAECPGVRVVR